MLQALTTARNFEPLRNFKLLLYTYKALNGLAPDYLANLLTFYKPVHTFRSSRSINLCMCPKI